MRLISHFYQPTDNNLNQTNPVSCLFPDAWNFPSEFKSIAKLNRACSTDLFWIRVWRSHCAELRITGLGCGEPGTIRRECAQASKSHGPMETVNHKEYSLFLELRPGILVFIRARYHWQAVYCGETRIYTSMHPSDSPLVGRFLSPAVSFSDLPRFR